MNVRAMIATIAIGGISGLFVGSDTAHAVRVGGHAAQIWGNQQACAGGAYAALENTCNNTETFTIPLVVGSSGGKALSFRATGDTQSNNVGCRGQAMNDANSGFWATPWTFMSQFGSVQTVNLGTLNVGNDGAVYMRCQIDNGGKLLSVEWEQ